MARILIIDDEANIRTMVSLALEQVGHSVDSAADGPEGITKYGDGSSCDLVLLDQRMPEMEGLDVLKKIRQRAPDARIIMITAFATIDLAVDALKAGAADFLRKPFTVETLRGAVQSSLGRAQTAGTTADPNRPAVTYWAGGINGYSIASTPDAAKWDDAGLTYALTIRCPAGDLKECSVIVPSHVVEQIKSRAGSKESDGSKRFWRRLCEHVVSNHLWLNPEPPTDTTFRLVEMDKDLARWIDSLPAR